MKKIQEKMMQEKQIQGVNFTEFCKDGKVQAKCWIQRGDGTFSVWHDDHEFIFQTKEDLNKFLSIFDPDSKF